MLANLFGAVSPSTIVMIVLLVVMVVVLIVLPMFTNRRRNKAINDLHSSLRPGDVIKTVGGIVGTIKEIKEIGPLDKEMVIETGVGDNKSTMVFDIQAVYQVMSKVNAPAEEAPAPAAEAPATEETKAEEPVVETPAEEAKAEEAATSAAEEAPVEEAKAEEAATSAAEKSKPAARKNAKK